MRIRIRRDRYEGWEVVAKHWWFPFWYQLGGTNTFSRREQAEKYAEECSQSAYDYSPRHKEG